MKHKSERAKYKRIALFFNFKKHNSLSKSIITIISSKNNYLVSMLRRVRKPFRAFFKSPHKLIGNVYNVS